MTPQLEILMWVRDGTPDGVYPDYRPRVIARALHNRGLIEVAGPGHDWKATVTDDGIYYLAHDGYPPDHDAPASMTPTAKPEAVPSTPRRPGAAGEPRPRRTHRTGPTDALMNALTTAEDHRIEVEYDQQQRYRQLALSAERFKKIPDGLQITISSDYRTCTAIVVLHPLPEWRARILDQSRYRG